MTDHATTERKAFISKLQHESAQEAHARKLARALEVLGRKYLLHKASTFNYTPADVTVPNLAGR